MADRDGRQNWGIAFWTYTPLHVASLARMLRQMTKELRILGFGFGRIGIYVIWYRDWYPDVPSQDIERGVEES